MAAGRTTTGPMASSASTRRPVPSISSSTNGSRRPNSTPMISEEDAMAHPFHHALSSVKKWGGSVDDYQPIHAWLDVPGKGRFFLGAKGSDSPWEGPRRPHCGDKSAGGADGG